MLVNILHVMIVLASIGVDVQMILYVLMNKQACGNIVQQIIILMQW